jgi:hypothetical protein
VLNSSSSWQLFFTAENAKVFIRQTATAAALVLMHKAFACIVSKGANCRAPFFLGRQGAFRISGCRFCRGANQHSAKLKETNLAPAVWRVGVSMMFPIESTSNPYTLNRLSLLTLFNYYTKSRRSEDVEAFLN